MKPGRRSLDFTFLFRQSLLIVLLSFLLLLDTTNRDLTWTAVNGFSLILFSGIVLFWLVYGSRLNPRFQLLLVGLIILGMAAWLTSADVYRSMITLGLMAIPLVLGLFSAELASRGWQVDFFINAILIVGGMMMAFTWVGVVQWYGDWLVASGGQLLLNVAYRLPAPNVQAWNLNPLIMLAGMRLLATRSKIAGFSLVVYLVSALALMFLTSSRGGWLATAAGLLVLGAFILLKRKGDLLQFWGRIKKSRFILGAFIILLAATVVMGGWFLYGQATHPSHGSLLGARSEYWPVAWETFLANPLFGQGLGTFSSVLLRAHSTPPFGIYLHAHSLPLTVLTESGLLGFLILLTALGLGGWLFWRASKREAVKQSVLYWGLLAAGAAALVHSMLDCMVGKTSGTWILAILLGLVFSQSGRVERKNNWVLFSSVAVVGFLAFIYFTSSTLQAAQAALSGGDVEQAEEYFQSTEVIQQQNAAFLSQYGLFGAFASESGNTSAITEAVEHYQQAILLDPDWALGHLNLSALLASEGNLNGAVEEINTAAGLSPDCALIQLNRGWLAEQTGEVETARTAYLAVLELEPEWREAAYWRENSLRISIQESWLTEHSQTEALSPTELESVISLNPDFSRLYLESAWLKLAEGDMTAAERLIGISRLVYLRTALDEMEADWLEAEVAAQQGDLPQAIMRAESALNRYLHQGLAGPGTHQGQIYANLVFRTIVGEAELAPQVVTIALPDRWAARIEQIAEWLRSAGDTQTAESWLETCRRLAFDQCR